MRNYYLLMMTAILLLLFCLPAQAAFPLQEGDTWVMVGDSITAQHLHTNYFEAFCYARFPKMNFRFRNSGVGGDTLPRAMARFNWDTAAWQPTVVSVELGMNDAGAGLQSVPVYIGGMNNLTTMIRQAGARPVFLSASPVNDGLALKRASVRNQVLDKYALAQKDFAAAQQAPFADQFHALMDIWAANKDYENWHRFAASTKAIAARPIPGAELLKQWLEVWKTDKAFSLGADLGGDPVHPGPVGQVSMCAALLQGLGAPGLVSVAALDARSLKALEEKQCRLTGIVAVKGGIAFDRLDECLPMPMPAGSEGALIIYPAIADLSLWTLKVAGLKAGNYSVTIDGVKVAAVTAEQLAAGWNMGTLSQGPVADQGRNILALVAAKESLVGQWRGSSRALAAANPPTDAAKAALAKLAEQVKEADARIRAAAQPKPHRFEILPAS